jgi:hypothetical protein
MASSDAAIYLNAYGTRPAPFLLAQLTVCHMDAYCEMSGSVDPQVLVPPFNLTGNELGPVTAIDWRCARALGGNMRAAGQQWGRSIVWSPCAPPLAMADI